MTRSRFAVQIHAIALLATVMLAFGTPAMTFAEAGALRADTQADVLPQRFDPSRDAAADLQRALEIAARTERRVIVDVGGEWCTWCHIMDRFFEANPELQRLRDRHYVWLRINYSKENPNAALLGQWPRVAGYPHLFVLDARGRLLHSQNTDALESGRSYDARAMRDFLIRFSPASAPAGKSGA